MRKWLLILLLMLGAWQFYQHRYGPLDSGALFDKLEQSLRARKAPAFNCDDRQYCSQMTSLEEAIYFINHCPDTRMDSDQDGRPCENDPRFAAR